MLECGTGSTTMLANELGLQRGFTTFCLEQDLKWARGVQEWNPRAVHIIGALLRDYFSLIVCDGPYIDMSLGEPHYSSWRYGLLPWLKENGKSFGTLLLDDVNDPRASALLERWTSEFGLRAHRTRSEDGELAVITA